MKQKISITVEDDLLKTIDAKRGLIDRSSYLEEILKHAIGSRRGGSWSHLKELQGILVPTTNV